jgi:hypothetical protein
MDDTADMACTGSACQATVNREVADHAELETSVAVAAAARLAAAALGAVLVVALLHLAWLDGLHAAVQAAHGEEARAHGLPASPCRRRTLAGLA